MCKGGNLTQTLLPLLHYKRSIHDIFWHAACFVPNSRPWVRGRPSLNPLPILGSVEAELPKQPMFLVDPSQTPWENRFDMVLIGETNMEATAVKSILLAREKELSHVAQHEDFLLQKRLICRMVFPTGLEEDQKCGLLSRIADRTPGGIDLYVVVLKMEDGSVGASQLENVRNLFEMAGEQCLPHLLLVCTNAGELRDLQPSELRPFLEDMVVDAVVDNQTLSNSFCRVGGVVAVHCSDEEGRQVAREVLQNEVLRLASANGHAKHKHPAFHLAAENQKRLLEI